MNVTTKQNIRNLSLVEIQDYLVRISEKPFRAKQIFEWLWKKNASHFDEMSNLSLTLRNSLENDFFIDHIY